MHVFITAIKSAFVPRLPEEPEHKQNFHNSHFTSSGAVQSLLRLRLILLLLICLCTWKEPSRTARGPFYSEPSEEALPRPVLGVMLILYVNLTWLRDAQLARKTFLLDLPLRSFVLESVGLVKKIALTQVSGYPLIH